MWTIFISIKLQIYGDKIRAKYTSDNASPKRGSIWAWTPWCGWRAEVASMATLTNSTFLFPHNPFFNLHHTRFKCHPSLSLHYRSRLLRRFSKYTVSQAIRTPKFDFNFTSFEDDDYGDQNFQKRRRTKGRKSGRRSKQKRWWSDDLDDESDVKTGLVEQIVDSLWILRVWNC